MGSVDVLICVVYDGFNDTIEYKVITNQKIIDDALYAPAIYLAFGCNLPGSVEDELGKLDSSETFPHTQYKSAFHPEVITVYM